MLAIGTRTQYGIVQAIGWVGERYYWLLKDGAVAMMPASVIESEDPKITDK